MHGFASTPRELEGIGEALHAAGMTVWIPRLPGHGTDGRDFLDTGFRDWLRCCTDCMLDLSARHQKVSLVGFSMGGLLAVILAARFPVRRLALLAPPLLTRDPRLPFMPIAALFVRRLRRRSAEPLPDDPGEALLAREYRGYRYPRQLAGILRLSRLARLALPRVTADILTVAARGDPYVRPEVVAWIEARARAARGQLRGILVEGSHRSLLEGEASAQVREEVVRWLVGAPAPGAPAPGAPAPGAPAPG